MPAWPARLIAEFNANDRRATEIAGGLTVQQLNWSEAPGVWSVGQCLQHLKIANDVYLAPIARALDGKTEHPVDEITPGWFGRWFITNHIEPSDKIRRGRAPSKIAVVDPVDASILQTFLRTNETARALVTRAGAYDVNRIRFQNPFVPVIFFTVGTGLEIVHRHQKRHLLQAARVKAAAAFPR